MKISNKFHKYTSKSYLFFHLQVWIGSVIGILWLIETVSAQALSPKTSFNSQSFLRNIQRLENNNNSSIYAQASKRRCLTDEQDKEYENNPRPSMGNIQINKNLIQEVRTTARKITVRIEWWSNDRTQMLDYGSGVIVAKQNQNYYVLTNEHVVHHQGIYLLITPDGKRHEIDYNKIKKPKAIDLAILQFTSSQNYNIATLANFGADSRKASVRELSLIPKQSIFVSGWSSNTLASSEQTWLFHWGTLNSHETRLFSAYDYKSLARGYELVYTAPTYGGMSGGPILDPDGRVIGIHGHSEGGSLVEDTADVISIYRGFSMGVPIKKFLRIAPELGVLCNSLSIENSFPRALVALDPDWVDFSILQNIPSFLAYSAIKDPGWKTHTTSQGDQLASTWINQANLYWRVGKTQEANTAFQRATAIKPDSVDAWYGIAVTSLPENYPTALKVLNQVTLTNPDFYQAFRLKGLISLGQRNYEEALVAFNKVIQIQTKNREQIRDAQIYFYKGLSLYLLRRYKDALEAFNTALKIDSYALCYCMRGDTYSALGNFNKAIEDYTKMIDLFPESSLGYISRARARQQIGDITGAITDFSIALNDPLILLSGLQPGNYSRAEVYSMRGDGYLIAKDYAKAIQDYNKALSENPNLIQAFWGRGRVFFFKRNLKEAISDLSQVIQRDKNFPDAYAMRGLALADLNGIKAGTPDIQKALKIYQSQGNMESYQYLLRLFESLSQRRKSNVQFKPESLPQRS